MLIGAGRPAWTLQVAAPLPIMAVAGHFWAIPRFGLIGAAWVTLLCATAGAALTFAAIHRLWQVAPPATSVMRSALIAAAGAVAAAWPTAGMPVPAKLVVLGVACLALLFASGELDRADVRSWLRGRRAGGGVSDQSSQAAARW